MKKSPFPIVAAVTFSVGMLLTAGAVFAHHAFAAEYDANKPIQLKGVIVKMAWTNPHAWLYIDVKEPDGKTSTWALEFGSPTSLYRRGWRREDLPVGAEVSVTAFLAKTNPKAANAKSVVLADGRNLFAGSPGTGAPQ